LGRTLSRTLAWGGPLITLLALALALTAGLLLVRLTVLDGVLFVVLAIIGMATVIEPLVGVAAALFLGPLRAYLSAEVPQIPAQIGQVFVALAIAAWLAQGLAGREIRIPNPLSRHREHRGSPLQLALVAFLGAALLSLWDAVGSERVGSPLLVYGVPELIKWVQILLLFLFVSQHLTPQRLPWLLGALLLTGLFQASVGVWQFVLRGEGPEHFAIVADRFYRAYGTFEQPNPYAGYIGMTLALVVGALWGILTDKGTRGKRGLLVFLSPCLLVALAMLAALGMSWSRGAWLGFGATVLAMAIALPRKAHWGLLLVAVLLVAVLGLYTTGLLPASVEARLIGFADYVRFEDVRGVGINDANYAVIERLAHWQAALAMFRHNLWTGVGLGCYEPAYRDFALINWPIALGHAHNYYLNVAAETGLIGLVAYLLLWAAVFWQTWRATRRAQGFLRGLAIGLLGAWTHLSVHHFLDNLYVNNVHLHIGVLLGLLAFIIQQTQETSNDE
jgi:putative inorganic carbon (HCO3(-)) transporter